MWLVRRPPALLRGPFRRPVLVGGGRRRGALGRLSPRPGSRSARQPPARGRRRASSTQDWGPWLGDVAKSTAIGAVFAGVGAAAALALMRRFPAALVAARRASSPSASPPPASTLGPVVLDPIFNRFRRCPRGARAATCWPSRARRRSRSARSTRSTPAGARRPPTPTSPGSGATKRVVLYDNLLQGLHAATRCASWSPTSSATCTTATCRAACSTSRSWRRRALRRVAAHATARARTSRARGPAALPGARALGRAS